MAKNTRDQRKREADRATIAARYLAHTPQAEIARELGITQAQVSKDLKALRAEWKASAIRDFDTLRAEQLAKIDLLERHYWEGYERSLKARTKERVGQTTGSQNATTTASVTTENRDGSVAWLQGVERCLLLRMRLLALDEVSHQAAGVLAKAYSGFDMSAI